MSDLDRLLLSQGVILWLVEMLSGLRGSLIVKVIHKTSLFTLGKIFSMGISEDPLILIYFVNSRLN